MTRLGKAPVGFGLVTARLTLLVGGETPTDVIAAAMFALRHAMKKEESDARVWTDTRHLRGSVEFLAAVIAREQDLLQRAVPLLERDAEAQARAFWEGGERLAWLAPSQFVSLFHLALLELASQRGLVVGSQSPYLARLSATS